MGRNTPFRFKQFEVSHSRSSMKVGVDAVVLGAWADIEGCADILEVGCGCGVISLMCAQRNREARIVAIDIDGPSVEEAGGNFAASPWGERLGARLEDFNELVGVEYDYIISNPPYFESGVSELDSARLIARHQAQLSPRILLRSGYGLLRGGGRIGIVVPADQKDNLIEAASERGLNLRRVLIMRGRPELPEKRAFLEFEKFVGAQSIRAGVEFEDLCVSDSDGNYSLRYIELCKDFYLKF